MSPPAWNAAGAVDKLPQPFRMLDKILAEVVEQVMDVVGLREQQKKAEEASRIELVSVGGGGAGDYCCCYSRQVLHACTCVRAWRRDAEGHGLVDDGSAHGATQH